MNVDDERHVTWFANFRTRINIAVIFWQNVNIVKDETIERVETLGFDEADIEQHAAIKN